MVRSVGSGLRDPGSTLATLQAVLREPHLLETIRHQHTQKKKWKTTGRAALTGLYGHTSPGLELRGYLENC